MDSSYDSEKSYVVFLKNFISSLRKDTNTNRVCFQKQRLPLVVKFFLRTEHFRQILMRNRFLFNRLDVLSALMFKVSFFCDQ